MKHWTFTGSLAGRPFCGVNKQEALDRGDTFVHWMYDRDSDGAGLCPDCKQVIDSLGEEED